jgi:hypothetical protein
MRRLVSPAALLLAAVLAVPAGAPAQQAGPAVDKLAGDSGDPVTCTGTLSGAVQGAFACRVSVAIDGESVTFRVEALGPVAGVRTLVPADLQLAMPLRARTYARDAVTAGQAVVELTGGERYAASGRQGELRLTLDSAERYRQARNFYVVSGELVAHLVAAGQARGEVVLEVRF